MNGKEIFYEDKEKYNASYYPLDENITDPALIKIDEIYGAADSLSILNAEKNNRILLILSIVGTLITISFLLYDEAELHGLIVACIVMILCLFFIRRISNRLDCHRKYIEYRVLAETLRVQYFLCVAGIKENVIEILPWFTKKSIPWIEEVILSLPTVEISEKKSILDCWIRDQKAYHDSALKKSEAKKQRNDRTTKIVIVITIIFYIVALLFEFHMYTGGEWANANVIRAILKIILGTMSAVTIFTGSYYGKMSLSNIIDDHKRMSALYEQAEKDISQNGETDELIIFLAREFLIENGTWYAYQNKNKPDIII